MSTYVDELEGLLDDADLGEFDERVRASVRTPSNRSSFQARQAPVAASQSQLQSATHTLDAKIETLASGLKALEGKANALGAESERTRAALRKEIAERRRSGEATANDLQQTKLLTVLLPMLSQGDAITVADDDGKQFKVATQSTSQIAQLLPMFLLLGPGLGAGKGMNDMMLPLILLSTLGKR